MISHEDIKNLVTESGLREDIIEKDYVIGWVLWGISSAPELADKWIFKGGTCIKKCYVETYRFSEDLDFTVVPGGLIKPDELLPIFNKILARISEESGIDFSVVTPRFSQRESPLSVEGRIYYRGPRNTPTPCSIKLDLDAAEKVVCLPVLRKISHPSYKDKLPSPAQIKCYAFEELFAEKIRAMGERCRPRDLYDIVYIFRREDFQAKPRLIQSVLERKCDGKGIPVPTFASIEKSPYRDELLSEWENMLGHQLPTLPPFEKIWEELPRLFGWLEGTYLPKKLTSIPVQENEDIRWAPPPTSWSWAIGGVPLESIRFAAANQLCVELGYKNSKRIIEPYSLRRTKDENLILHAIRTDNREHRTYRVDRIQSVKVTTEAFEPVLKIEFLPTGMTEALPTPRKPRLRSNGTHFGPIHIFECPLCGKIFKRSKYDSTLRPHNDKNGRRCPGRSGYFVDTRYD